jgi:hypothetical protein
MVHPKYKNSDDQEMLYRWLPNNYRWLVGGRQEIIMVTFQDIGKIPAKDYEK